LFGDTLTDLCDITKSGIFAYGNNTPNAPSTISGFVIAYHLSTNNIITLIVSFDGNVYYRKKLDGMWDVEAKVIS